MWHGLPAHENTAKACPELVEGMAVPQIGFELGLFWLCFGFVFMLILDNILRDIEGVR